MRAAATRGCSCSTVRPGRATAPVVTSSSQRPPQIARSRRPKRSPTASFGHLRYRYSPADRLWLEALVQIGENRFQDIDIRNLVGAGPRYTAIRYLGFEWSLGLAYVFEYEQLGGDVDFPRGTERFTHRWSATSSARFDHGFLTIRQVMFA